MLNKFIHWIAIALFFTFSSEAGAQLTGCSYRHDNEDSYQYIDFHLSKKMLRLSNSVSPDEGTCEFTVEFEIRIVKCSSEYYLQAGDVVKLTGLKPEAATMSNGVCPERLEISSTNSEYDKSIYLREDLLSKEQ